MDTAEHVYSSPFANALKAQGIIHPQLCRQVLNDLLMTINQREFEPDDLYVQLNPRFVEGSAPMANSERGKLVDIFLHGLLALDAKTIFKVGMDGFGQHGGGLIVLDVDNDFDHLLVTKGDRYNLEKVGVIGGQGADVDEGDDLKALLREQGQEVGRFPFDPDRFFKFVQTQAVRRTDSRVETYWVKATFYVFLATGAEMQAMRDGYKLHVARTGGDPEILGLNTLTRREVLDFVRSQKIVFAEQAEAFVTVALTIPYLLQAEAMLRNSGYSEPKASMVWGIARELALPELEEILAYGEDWRNTLIVDGFFQPQ